MDGWLDLFGEKRAQGPCYCGVGLMRPTWSNTAKECLSQLALSFAVEGSVDHTQFGLKASHLALRAHELSY